MLLVTPGYHLTSGNKLIPAMGGCVLVSGGRLATDGRIVWDGPTVQPATREPKL